MTVIDTTLSPISCCAPLSAPVLSDEEAEATATLFRALADPARVRLVNILAVSGQVCVCELVEPLGRSQPTVSHHLRILAEAGLIEGEKRGRWVWYRAVPEKLAALRGVLA